MSNERLERALELARARGPSRDAVARMKASLDAGVSAKPVRLGHALTKPWVAGAFVTGAAILSAIAIHHRPSTSQETTIGAAPLAAPPPTTTIVAAHETTSEVPTIAVDELPRTQTAEKVTPKPVAETELALVQRAQAALVSDPSLALSLADRHAAKFPNGELAQEREVVAIEALAKLGRTDDASARGARYLAENPHTPYRLRVERALARSP